MNIRGTTFAAVTNELVVDSNNSFYVAAGIGIVKMKITEASGTKRIWEISDWTIVK